MEYQNFDCEIAEDCAVIGMIGPGAPPLADFLDEFTDLMLRLQEDRAVRVILFTDGDHSFELHHNLDEAAEAHHVGAGLELVAIAEKVSRNIVTLLADSAKPVIAATRGDVRDFGLGFFMAADIRLASSAAVFTCQDMSGGLMPGWNLTHTLPRMIGPGRTLDFLWSHRTIAAQEAWQIGLVDRLIDDSLWEQELSAFTQRLAKLPQPGVQLSKMAVQQAADLDQTTMFSLEWEAQQQCWASLETAEGMAARREGRENELGFVVDGEDE